MLSIHSFPSAKSKCEIKKEKEIDEQLDISVALVTVIDFYDAIYMD